MGPTSHSCSDRIHARVRQERKCKKSMIKIAGATKAQLETHIAGWVSGAARAAARMSV